MESKKAISGVVATILIVLLAVVAVTMFWFALKPVLQGTTERIGAGQECIYLNLDIREAVYNSSSSELKLKVHRDVGEASLQSVKFLVDGEEKTATPSESMTELATKPYTISGVASKPDKIEIAGVLENDKICGVASSIESDEIQTVL